MIVNKKFNEFKATVHYEIKYDGLASEDEIVDESIVVKNFDALLKCLGEFGIEKIREEHQSADSIKVVGLTLDSEKQEETSMQVQLFRGKQFNGWATTKIENEDIESRLMTNLHQVKRIIDNTLNEYPIRY